MFFRRIDCSSKDVSSKFTQVVAFTIYFSINFVKEKIIKVKLTVIDSGPKKSRSESDRDALVYFGPKVAYKTNLLNGKINSKCYYLSKFRRNIFRGTIYSTKKHSTKRPFDKNFFRPVAISPLNAASRTNHKFTIVLCKDIEFYHRKTRF